MTASSAACDDATLRCAIIAAALPLAACEGFTPAVLERAAEQAGAARDDLARLFPNGASSLIEAYSTDADAEMERRLAAMTLEAMPVRERIAAAVRTRLDILRPHKGAVRRAITHLSLPPNLPLGTTLAYRTSDAVWRAAGDHSTDFSFYTKRGILAGVYAATLICWFGDDSEGERATMEFLAARIEDVMKIERAKARVRKDAENGFHRLSEMLRARP